MGMTLDKAISHLDTYSSTNGSGQTTQEQHEEAKRVAMDTMRKYQKLQADYEARLKADMMAMLTDLKNKLIDKSWNIDMYDDDLDFECCYLNDIDEIVQQKINTLKENKGSE